MTPDALNAPPTCRGALRRPKAPELMHGVRFLRLRLYSRKRLYSRTNGLTASPVHLGFLGRDRDSLLTLLQVDRGIGISGLNPLHHAT